MTPPAPAKPLCGYCDKPADGPTVRLDWGDKSSVRVAIAHDPCHELLMAELVRQHQAACELPEGYAWGYCHICEAWAPAGQIVAEVEGDSGTGQTVVRCYPACKNPRPAVSSRARTHSA